MQYQNILDHLIEVKNDVGIDILFPVLDPEGRKLVPNNPYAFCVAASLNRGTKAEIIWTIPYWISRLTGHMNPAIFNRLPLSEIKGIFAILPRKPRYLNAAPRTFQSITELIIDGFGGKTQSIWEGKTAKEVK